MTKKEEVWIIKGYETFALFGEKGLVIEQLAKDVGVSKSSFYHHFADMEIFIENLLSHHLEKSKIIAEKEKRAETINPDLIDILIEHKTDLLFNRQLRINANKINYKNTLLKSNYIIGKDFITLWLTDTKISLTITQAEGLFELALENFFLQINPENIKKIWLESYFEYLKRIILSFGKPLYGVD
ncbi:MAG: TetR/AcrR family transcriptional regulator [Cytophagia bacterium]|nr:MAG: TetR/AcrR family transcriptional regulator [Cytophagia bacterium]TAG41489.1 MAG: TetR/AcrR family transcriptional regulator [Cytophagia bacterium]